MIFVDTNVLMYAVGREHPLLIHEIMQILRHDLVTPVRMMGRPSVISLVHQVDTE